MLTILLLSIVFAAAVIILPEFCAFVYPKLAHTAASIGWFVALFIMFTALGGWAVLTVLVALMVGSINLLLAVMMDMKQ
jgi:hypothetical protein